MRLARRAAGALGLGTAELPDYEKGFDKRPHMAILWVFVAFLIGSATRYLLTVSPSSPISPVKCSFLTQCCARRAGGSEALPNKASVLLVLHSIVHGEQVAQKRYKIKLPYSVVLLIIGGLLGYAEWSSRTYIESQDQAASLFIQ